ncbi:MAG: N-acetyltransferase [Chitinophagaceae bacterium]|nr:MAG: N-acetyltransferase [Chitinophagaceae bacterium]
MNVALIQTGTPEYDAMKTLRLEVLLRPIGVPESYIDPAREAKEHLVAAFDEDALVGCCILTPHADGRIQLRQMAVDGSRQGTGVGAAILRFTETFASGAGYTELFMHARDAVIPFYEKSEYRIRGDQFFEVGIPHHVMYKML